MDLRDLCGSIEVNPYLIWFTQMSENMKKSAEKRAEGIVTKEVKPLHILHLSMEQMVWLTFL